MQEKTGKRWVTWVNRCGEQNGRITLLGGVCSGENDIWVIDAEEVIRAVYYRGSTEYMVDLDGRVATIHAKSDEKGLLYLTTESDDDPHNHLEDLRINRSNSC